MPATKMTGVDNSREMTEWKQIVWRAIRRRGLSEDSSLQKCPVSYWTPLPYTYGGMHGPRDRGLNLKPVNEAVFLSSCTSSSCTRSYWFLERMVLRRPFGLLHVFLSLSGMQGSDYSFLGPFLRVMFTESNLDGWCYVCLWDKAGLLTACYKKGGFPTSVFLSGRAHPQRVEHLSETGHTLFMPGRGKPT